MYGAYRWLAVNRSEWSDTTPRDESVSTSGARARLDSWVLAFGMVGEDYDNPKFAVAEVAVTFVMGLTAGIANGRMSRVGCLMWFAFATFVIFAQTVALFVYGPLLNRFLEWFIAVSTFVTAVTTLFAFLQFMGNQIDYPTAYLSLNSFQMVISVVASLLNFIAAAAVLSQFVHALRRGKSSVSGEGEKRHHMVRSWISSRSWIWRSWIIWSNDIDLSILRAPAPPPVEDVPEPDIDLTEFFAPASPAADVPLAPVHETYTLDDNDDATNALDSEFLLPNDAAGVGSFGVAQCANLEQLRDLQAALNRSRERQG